MSGLRVERIDCLVLVEDLGRPGWAHLGVPPSGALDPASLSLANRLVGNPESCAGLEVLLGGLTLVAGRSLPIALTGAQLPLRVGGRAVAWGTAVPVPAGLTHRGGSGGRRVARLAGGGGGSRGTPVLGSRSTDTLSGLGPAPVKADDLLPLGQPGTLPAGAASAVPPASAAGETTLRLRLGPRDDWFTGDSLAGLWRTPFTVSPSSNRIALRLRGEPLVRRFTAELASEGLVTGAVQVPGDGRPLIFLADHPTTGGYPVVGVVDPSDLPRCAQLRPGDTVSFTPAR